MCALTCKKKRTFLVYFSCLCFCTTITICSLFSFFVTVQCKILTGACIRLKAFNKKYISIAHEFLFKFAYSELFITNHGKISKQYESLQDCLSPFSSNTLLKLMNHNNAMIFSLALFTQH